MEENNVVLMPELLFFLFFSAMVVTLFPELYPLANLYTLCTESVCLLYK